MNDHIVKVGRTKYGDFSEMNEVAPLKMMNGVFDSVATSATVRRG